MSYEARRNTIVSHGGKHGAGGTYLKGQNIAPEVARQLPRDLVAHDPTLDGAAPAAPVASAPATVTNAPAPAASAPVAPSATVPPASTTPVPPATGTLPSSVRELYALKKEELVKLASELGVTVPGEQTVTALREALKTGLGL